MFRVIQGIGIAGMTPVAMNLIRYPLIWPIQYQ